MYMYLPESPKYNDVVLKNMGSPISKSEVEGACTSQLQSTYTFIITE